MSEREQDEQEVERSKTIWRMLEKEQGETYKRVREMQELSGLGFRDNCFTIWTENEEK